MDPGPKPNSVIGVDLGGTKLLAGAIGPDLAIHSRVRHPVAGLGRQDLLDLIAAAVGEAKGGLPDDPIAVGIGVPGTVDPITGTVHNSTHLPLAGVPVAELLSERTGLPVSVDNDANCAALAEHLHGAAFGARNAVVMTVGTGIGGGLVVADALVRGAHGAAGELGHIPVEPGGLDCGTGCPSSGCLETRVSGPALEREAERLAIAHPDSGLGRAAVAGALHGAQVVELAHDGDLPAVEAVGIVGRWLGVGLVAVANMLDPEVVVIGGGLSAAGDLLLEPARAVLAERAAAPASGMSVVTAKFGADAGLLGASLLAREALRSKR